MTDLRQAAQAVIKAWDNDGSTQTMEDLRTALEQPEPEPTPWRDMVVVSLVREGIDKHRARELADHFAPQQQAELAAWGVFDGNLHDMFFTEEEAQEMVRLKGDGSTVAPLYTTPPAAQPKQKPMHPELRKMWEDYFDKCFRAQPEQEPVCPECKAKVLFECVACSSNNYPPQMQAEPVAYYHPQNGFYWAKPTSIFAPTVVDVPPIPLYTTLPQRTWVKLTDEDWEQIHDKKGTSLDTFDQGAAWAQARLKELNK